MNSILGSGTKKATGENKANPVLLDENICILILHKRPPKGGQELITSQYKKLLVEDL
ncbi:MAG: hypothetical protein HQ551_02470 [Desulfobacteraceae bacterium]|nr:hypothetical protein [Desulfobacteraceae bacterium]